MALLVDGSAPSIADLRRYEAGVMEVATIERIDLADKCSVTREEAQSELLQWFRSEGLSAGDLDRIVITEPLRRWLVLDCLERFYRDAHFGQGNERYGEKWKAYRMLARSARWSIESVGLGLVSTPLRKPAKPLITPVAGEGAPGTYFVQIAWTDETSGAESETSEVIAYTLQAPGSFRVGPSGLPDGVTRWHIYAGYVADDLYRQTLVSIPAPGIWELPMIGLIEGPIPGDGQTPDELLVATNRLRRG